MAKRVLRESGSRRRVAVVLSRSVLRLDPSQGRATRTLGAAQVIEPNDIPDADLGPLAALIGTWSGDKGIDVAPEPNGTEENPYYETLCFEPVGEVRNAESQVLTTVRYLQIVRRKSDDVVFHDQTGYWMWDAASSTVMQSLTIPRAVCVLAGGEHAAAADPAASVRLRVHAKLDDPNWGIVQSPFMRDKARTLEFSHELTIKGDRLSYSETTQIDIYGRSFEHTDRNELTRQSD